MATTSGEYVIPRSASDGSQRPTAPIMVQVYAQSDVGRAREHNEDAYIVANLSRGEPLQFARLIEQPADESGILFMVADGMGGAAAGEIASATAVDVVLRHLRDGLGGRKNPTADEFVTELNRAAEIANWSIFYYASSHPELRGMGTTATIAALLGDTLYLAQVGDSRGYLIRDGVAIQLTKDQSLMQKLIEAGELTEEEAALSDRRNIILQALGPEPSVKLDLTFQQVRRGDVMLLCSDGLSGLLRPEQLAAAVNEELDLAAACDRLIATANDLGGPDNITVVAARFDGPALQEPSGADRVGHREFPLGAESAEPTQADAASRVTAPVAVAVAPPVVDDARRRRGEAWIRAIAAAGALLVLWLAWKLLGR